MFLLADVNCLVRQAQAVAESDIATAVAQTKTIFLAIMKAGRFFIIPEKAVSEECLSEKNFRPYIAPVQEGGAQLYLRVFSHWEAAAHFATTLSEGSETQICELSSVETLQLAKFWFLRGVEGFMLNDGADWAAITMEDFLQIFFVEILEEPCRLNPAYVHFVRVLRSMRQPTGERYFFARDSESSYVRSEAAGLPTGVYLVSESQRSLFDGAGIFFEPLNEFTLRSAGSEREVPQVSLCDLCHTVISFDEFRALLLELGMTEREEA